MIIFRLVLLISVVASNVLAWPTSFPFGDQGITAKFSSKNFDAIEVYLLQNKEMFSAAIE